jgi:type VI secretion system protein ImpL
MLLYVVAATFLIALWGITLWSGIPIWIALSISAVVLILIALRVALVQLRARKAVREIEGSLARQAEHFEKRARPDQQGELRSLQAEFQKSLDALKSSRLGKGRGGALYALPWYAIIGPPGAGKSTAIRESGLKFPLQGKQASVRGIGGTRNCDWWLSNEAVLLDTAGRYATEDDDHEEWLGFLDMLRRARPKLPLNGIIVAVSIADLATASEGELDTLAQKVRERIDEVMARLGLLLPVYVLLTKCDLVPGFVESFDDLRKNERGQVLGFTLPVSDGREISERVTEQWTRLVQVIERRAITRVSQARGTESRLLVHGFPQQLEALQGQVVSLLSSIFVDNVYQDTAMLRGVYLTSGTQEGSPINRLMDAMASAFGLSAAPGSTGPRADTKSYFLGELFSHVLFPDQELAIRSTRAERRLQLLRVFVAAALALAALALASLPVGAFLENRALLITTQQELAAVAGYYEAKRAKAVPLEVLEPLRQRLLALRTADREGAHFLSDLGLYEGDALIEPVHSFYTSTLRSALVQPIVTGIAASMLAVVQANEGLGQVPTSADHAQLYLQTRAYLLLTSPREAAQPKLDASAAAWLQPRLVDAWSQASGKPGAEKASPAQREAMGAHIATYLELLAQDEKLGFARDRELVQRARELLSRVPQNKLAIDRIVAELDALGLDLSFTQMVGATGLPVSATGRVRGAFTRRAWDEYVRELLSKLPAELVGDAWVLEATGQTDDDSTQEARLCALRSEYFGRYVDEWKAFIGSVRVEEPLDNGRAVVVLQDLTRGQPPPLERLMRSVAYNAQLAEPKKEKGAVEKAAEASGILDRIREKVADTPAANLLAKRDPCAGGEYLTDAQVREALAGFFSFGATLDEPVEGAPPQLTSVQIYQEQLSFVRDALQAYLDSPTAAEPLLARLAAARTRVRSLIETQEVGWRPRFDALLWPPINGASGSSTSALAGEKGSQWCTSVVVPFDRTLRGRYPFARQGQDAALADVAEFYRPTSGILWSFYESSLKRDVNQIGDKFQLQQGTGIAENFSGELVRFLNRSATLTNVLFGPRGEKPRVDFEVRVRPSPGIASTIITIDGQLIDFHNGPEKWIRITWPGPEGKPGASMRVRGASIDETLKQDGEWGLFRLLEKGTISANPGERFFTVRFRLHTQNDVTIDIRPARADNPFVGTKAYLEAFRADGVQTPRAIAVGSASCPQ